MFPFDEELGWLKCFDLVREQFEVFLRLVAENIIVRYFLYVEAGIIEMKGADQEDLCLFLLSDRVK